MECGTRRWLVRLIVAGLGGHWLLAWLLMPGALRGSDDRHSFNISEAHIIALDPSLKQGLQASARRYLHVEAVHIFRAINATEALRLAFDRLPLYTKLLFQHKARHDHMQLSSAPMLGCLLSHMAVWRLVQPGAVVAVLEEDAVLDQASADRLRALSVDLEGVAWDLLMLESGQLTTTGEWRHVGQVAATCAHEARSRLVEAQSSLLFYSSYLDHNSNTTTTSAAADGKAGCTWQGSRGYLVGYEGAQLLLRHAEPAMVQVDGLMALVAMFEPRFHMYWPRVDIVHHDYMRMSTIWDGCIKCYLPTSPLLYLLGGLAIVALLLLHHYAYHYFYSIAR